MAEPSLEAYLAAARGDERSEVARRIEGLRNLTADERLKALDAWMQEMLAVLGGRRPAPEPGHPFWRHWKDPTLGRPA
jgi:hypothetical protein